MLAWFGCSLALFVGALSERAEIVHVIWHPISYILFPLSGAAFSVDSLPTVFQSTVLLLPMVHGVEILREGYFGTHFHAHYDIAYMGVLQPRPYASGDDPGTRGQPPGGGVRIAAPETNRMNAR